MVLASSSLHAGKKVKVLLFLLWIAASTNEEGFHVVQLYLPQLVQSLPGTHYSWIGWKNVVSFLFKETQALVWCYLTFPD